MVLDTEAELKPVVTIFNSAGLKIAQFAKEKIPKAKLVKMAWTDMEKILTVYNNGLCCLHDIHGRKVSEFELGEGVEQEGILFCHVWAYGMVVMTNEFKLFSINSFENPEPYPLCHPPLDEAPTCMTVVEPQYTKSGNVEVLLALSSGTLLLVDVSRVDDQLSKLDPVSHMTVSPNGAILGLFTRTGVLYALSMDLSKNMIECDTRATRRPRSIVWCGTMALLVCWDTALLMIGPTGQLQRYSFDSMFHVFPEFDCARIVTSRTCEILRRVPMVTQDIFSPRSTHEGAILYTAAVAFESKSPKADEHIRQIQNELDVAVETCIDAAVNEFDPKQQKALLMAASFGKTFVPMYSSEHYVEMCRTIRVLNAVRDAQVGIPLTFVQFKRLSVEVLVDRLIYRHQHMLALRICEYMGLRKDKVLIHWACQRVNSSGSDQEICQSIVDKLKAVKGVSFVEIAATANLFKKTALSTMLLEYETRAAQQVPLLLQMKQEQLGLVKAIESGDSNLIFMVLLHMEAFWSESQIFQAVANVPEAADLYICYLLQKKDADRQLKFVEDYYHSVNKEVEASLLYLNRARGEKSIENRKEYLTVAQSMMAQKAEGMFYSQSISGQIALIEYQREFLGKPIARKRNPFKLSVTDTIKLSNVSDLMGNALKIKKDFKVSDKQFCWLAIQALSDAGDWERLEAFSQEKKPAIGYQPFVDVCIALHAPMERIMHFIGKLSLPKERSEQFLRIRAYREAAVAAMEIRDKVEKKNALLEIRQECNVPEVNQMLDRGLGNVA